MKPDFWHNVWHEGRLGFHRESTNQTLVEHASALQLTTGSRVVVPLAGKSRDMTWLARQGAQVTGIELSPVACEQFFRERAEQPTSAPHGSFTRWEAGDVCMLQGDIFELNEPPFDAFYDRAATVALDPATRAEYASVLARHIKPGGRGLLLTMVYDEQARTGPPFCVRESEVQRVFGPWFTLEKLAEGARLPGTEGARRIEEQVWMLTRQP
jgi:thiopurine S-methyltransferase